MAKARKISDAEWESHKETIRELFLTQDKILQDVLKIMEESRGFSATYVKPNPVSPDFSSFLTT
jgi:hypothetical protein